MSTFRRLRGLAGIAAVWAVAWLPLGAIMGIYRVQGLQHGWQFDMTASARLVAMVTVFWMVWGAITGLLFGGILIRTGRRETLGSLSVRRVGFWGTLAGVVPPTLVILLVWIEEGVVELTWFAIVLIVACALVSAACASVTLILARRAPSDHQRGCLTSA